MGIGGHRLIVREARGSALNLLANGAPSIPEPERPRRRHVLTPQSA
jgi:hypothetical protein